MSVIRKGRTTTRRAALALGLSGAALLACSEQTPLESPGVAVTPHFDRSNSPPLASLGWQQLTRSLVAANNLGAPPAARVYALVSVAQYGALTNRHDPDQGDQSHDEDGQDGHGRGDFQRGAVAGASSVVLTYLFPSSAAALAQRVADEAAAAGTPHFARGVEDGKTMGNRLVEWAKADRFEPDAAFTGTKLLPPQPTGQWWSSTALMVGPTFGNVAPYVLTSGSQFRPPPPPAFNSAKFLADLAEILLISDTRTPEQVAIARFWAFPAGTPSTGGYWNQVASDFIVQYGLNERKATHVFGLMHAAMLDATIGCWDTKYVYLYIRPPQADPAINTSPIGLPNHPSFPSGHACQSSAATTVLTQFFPKQAEDLQRQLDLAGLSRMYAGIHYRFDIDAGQKLGTSVGEYAIRFDHREGLLSRIP